MFSRFKIVKMNEYRSTISLCQRKKRIKTSQKLRNENKEQILMEYGEYYSNFNLNSISFFLL